MKNDFVPFKSETAEKIYTFMKLENQISKDRIFCGIQKRFGRKVFLG